MHRPVTLGVLSVSMSILLPATLVAQTQTSDSLTVLRIMQIDEVGVTGNLASPTRSAMTHTPLFDRKSAAAAPFQTLEAALRPVPAHVLEDQPRQLLQEIRHLPRLQPGMLRQAAVP